MGVLRVNIRVIAEESRLLDVLAERLVGCLGVDVDQEVPFICSYEVICGLPAFEGTGQDHFGPGNENLLAAAGVLHMDRFRAASGLNLGDEPVGAAYECSTFDVLVIHVQHALFQRYCQFF